MPEQLMMMQPGDRFATMSEEGEVRIYGVPADGVPQQIEPPYTTEPVGRHAARPRHRA